jgi:sterol-4alpha-carboxylate 3-dehydrogenase (decarboxylating)
MLNVDSFPSVPFALAWLIGLLNEIQAALKGKTAGISRRTVKALCSSNSFSNQKARDLLGWEPKIDIDEGMQRTEFWLRAEGYI